MFGFPKKKLHPVPVAIEACRSVLAGIGTAEQPLSDLAFSDAYVMGFLQEVVIAAARAAQGRYVSGNIMMRTMEATRDALVPGLGKQIIPALALVNKPDHAGHLVYKTGRADGKAYDTAIKDADQPEADRLLQQFQTFVHDNYVGFA